MKSRSFKTIKENAFHFFQDGKSNTMVEIELEITESAVKRLRAMYDIEILEGRKKLLDKVKMEMEGKKLISHRPNLSDLKKMENYGELVVGDVII